MKTRSVTHRTPYAHSYTEKRSAPFLLSLLFFFLPQTVLHFTTPFFICRQSSQNSVPQTHNLSIWPSCFHLLNLVASWFHIQFFFGNPLMADHHWKVIFFKNKKKSLIIFPQFLIMSSGLFGCYLEAVRVGNKWKIRMKWRARRTLWKRKTWNECWDQTWLFHIYTDACVHGVFSSASLFVSNDIILEALV